MDDILGYTQLYHKFRTGYKIFLVDLRINICDNFRRKVGSKIIDMVLPTLRKYVTTSPCHGTLIRFFSMVVEEECAGDFKKLIVNGTDRLYEYKICYSI